jgi:hypothetical protein
MNASAKRTLRLGITAGLSLGAIVGLVGCAAQTDDVSGDNAAVESENGFSTNGYSSNGFSINGFSTNGFSMNGFSTNGFSMNGSTINGFSTNGFSNNGFSSNGYSINGFSNNGFSNNGLSTGAGWKMDGLQSPATLAALSGSTGLASTAGGREFIKYLVKVAFPSGASLTVHDNATPPNSYTYPGSLGVAAELATGNAAACDIDCQEKVSAAMLAHVNNSGLHVGIWLVGPDTGIGWDTSSNYPYQEGAYFGNIFAPNPHGNYCGGANLSAGAAKGRMGNAIVNSSILTSPYGTQWDSVTSQNVPVFCANGTQNYCASSGGGFTSCQDGGPTTPYSTGHSWQHVVTVWRNFEPTQLYKICNKNVGKCLGVVGGSMTAGANIEQRAYTGALGQTWQILQVNPGQYKVINRTSGMALDMNGTQAVQNPYTGASSQLLPINYISADRGWANLVTMSMSQSGHLLAANPSYQYSDGALIQDVATTTGGSSPDPDRWGFYPIGLATFDPGRYNRLIPQNAQGSSIDIANASTTNGTTVQIYSTWNGDPQKFIVADAGNGNVKITMKLNTAKCIGPNYNGTTAGTQLVVQDCNGSFNQAWMTSEQGAGSGIFAYRNAAAPGLCMDVAGASSANGTHMQLWNCTGASNQLFKVLAQ